MYNVGSLFAGVGGICLGFKRASGLFNLVTANEMDKNAILTYKHNFDHNLIEGDIEKILNPNIINIENTYLTNRLDEFSNREEPKFFVGKDKIKKVINSLKSSYLLKHYLGAPFEVSSKFEKEILDLGAKKEEFEAIKVYIEKEIILYLYNQRDEKWTETEINKLKEKNKELLKEKIDILTAGFPCQAFSIAGEGKGFNDHRGELFYSVLEWAKQLEEIGHGKPRVLFLENVKNLVSHDDGRTFKRIVTEIQNFGYKFIKYQVMNTCDYTELPQNRERIFVVCFLNEEDANNFGEFKDIEKIQKNKEAKKLLLASTLDYSLTKDNDLKYYYTPEKYPTYFKSKDINANNINLYIDINEMYEVYQVRRGMYVRKNQSGVCPTLTANMGTGGHNVPLIKMNDGVRKLTPIDCFNLQGFRVGEDYSLPDISDASLYKQSGNAVSVDLIKIIAKKIFVALNKADSTNKKVR